MNKSNTAILLIVTAGIALWLGTLLPKHEIYSLQEKPEEQVSRHTEYEYQEKCANQAEKTFNQLGWDKEPLTLMQNHYNKALNKCFVLIENTTKSSQPVNSKVLVDAYEGKTYAAYLWMADKVKKYWEVPPIKCSYFLPTGEELSCKSSDDFDEAIKAYMNE